MRKMIMEQAEADEELKRLREEAQATIAKAEQALKQSEQALANEQDKLQSSTASPDKSS